MSQQSLNKSILTLKDQEEKFADFVILKQHQIDLIQDNAIKMRMQGYLDKIAIQTYKHLTKMIDNYQKLLDYRNIYKGNDPFKI